MIKVERRAKISMETINGNNISITFTREKIEIDTGGAFVEISWENYHRIVDFVSSVETAIRAREQ